MLPPVAGTDLPNFGFRDHWQPLFGEVRTYVRSGDQVDFEHWKQAVRRGEVFVTSGPIIDVQVNGEGPGGIVRLPVDGGKVSIRAELSSPRLLKTLEVVQLGRTLELIPEKNRIDLIHRWTIETELTIGESCWVAARGLGGAKIAVERGLKIQQPEMAHTGVIQILVGERPIRDPEAVQALRRQLSQQKEYYRTRAIFEKQQHRSEFIELFDQAIGKLDGSR